MKSKDTLKLISSLILAAIFWTLIFGFQVVSFWTGMAFATFILATLSVYWEGWPLPKRDLTTSHILLGVGSAAVLYAFFFIGNTVAGVLFPFAQNQVSSIHMIREESSPLLIALILLFLTSPCEEIFWRGWVQKKLMRKFTPAVGWILGAVAYGAVHIVSANFMLVMAALVAGLFWGFLYWRTKSLWVCVISHALWTVSIFLLWPIGC